MATATIPTRFELDAARLAGALAFAGMTPAPGCGLPEPVPVKHPERVLRGAGVLDDAGQLRPEVDVALRVASSPERVVRILVDRPSATSTQVVQLMRTAGRDEVVAWGKTGDTFAFTVLGSVNQAVVLVDELLSITDLLAGGGSELIDLSAAGLAALLAVADALREDRLRAQLDRVTAPAASVLTASRLEDVYQRGLTSDDSRWAVTAIRVGAPIDLGALVGRLGAGLTELRAANLVTAGPGGDVPTARGAFVFGVLGQLVATSSLAVTFVQDGARFPVAPVTLLRTASTIWVVAWTGREADVRVSLADLTVEGALGVVSELLDTMAPPATPAPWSPTHLVPADGLDAWAEPDPSLPAVAHLDPRLDVQVVDRRDAWTRIVCSNGWSGWIDGSRLEEIT